MKEDNLVYGDALQNSYSGQTQTITEKQGKLDFKYAPGFKVGAGVLFDHDNWDLFANYTWLQQNNAHGHVSQNYNKNDTRTPANGDFNLAENFNTSQKNHANWTCHFNNIDLELGRSFFISPQLVLRPHFGLKTGWMDQKFNTSEVDANSLTPTGEKDGRFRAFDTTTTAQQRQHFWGIGLRAGLNTAWHFTRDWSIYGNIAASELSCRFKDSVTVTVTKDRLSSSIQTIDNEKLTKSFHILRPVLEIALGLRYETLFSKDRYQFFIQSGWEQQIWWDQNQFASLGTNNAIAFGGDLTMQGLDVKVGFAF